MQIFSSFRYKAEFMSLFFNYINRTYAETSRLSKFWHLTVWYVSMSYCNCRHNCSLWLSLSSNIFLLIANIENGGHHRHNCIRSNRVEAWYQCAKWIKSVLSTLFCSVRFIDQLLVYHHDTTLNLEHLYLGSV
jgi:hypothetical protein